MNNFIAAKQRGQQKLPVKLTKQGIKLSMGDLTISKNIGNKKLLVQRRMYVPENQKLQPFLLPQHHNPASQSHPGYKAIFQKLEEN